MLADVRAVRHAYEVAGWGVGEVWVRDGLLVQHELPSPEQGAPAGERLGVTTARVTPCPVALDPAASGPAPPMGGVGPPTGTVVAHPSQDRAGFVPELCRRVALHLEGERVEYDDVTIDLDWATAFQGALAEALRAVSWGEIVSYGELAALAGRPRAARAAGAFCAENRFALVVPCHRVVAANGIGGYGAGGVGLKRRLLAVEGVVL